MLFRAFDNNETPLCTLLNMVQSELLYYKAHWTPLLPVCQFGPAGKVEGSLLTNILLNLSHI